VQPPGSLASSIIGIIAGQLYRSDILGLKSFRLPRLLQRLASRFLVPLLGSTRPPRRTNRAIADETPSSRRTTTVENEEIITTTASTTTPADSQAPSGDQVNSTAENSSQVIPGQSVVREWVNELTSRVESGTPGLRVPRESEISQLMSMFPDLRREDIVGALQRSANVEAAVETLLNTQS